MSEIDLAEINTTPLFVIEGACGSETIDNPLVFEKPDTVDPSTWSSVVSSMLDPNNIATQRYLTEQFGINSVVQTPSGEIFIVPKDPNKDCYLVEQVKLG